MRALSHRFASATVALVLLAAQLGAVAHLSVVDHVACVEHGELVEVGVARTPPAMALPHDFAAMHESTEASHGHDHCGVATLRREHGAGAPVAGSHRADSIQPGSRCRVEVVSPPRAIALLALAPKSSPPV